MAATETPKPEFVIQRIYVKDMSFEVPNAPEIFKEEWKPEVKFELNTANTKMGDKEYEVVIGITVTAEVKGKVAFLVEAKQAGIFTIDGVEEAQLSHLLGSFCPSVLFPYLREAVSDLVSRGSFPHLYLAPINFDAVYAEHLKQRQEGGEQAKDQKAS
jgi:preprotein translocase subunit SecB